MRRAALLVLAVALLGLGGLQSAKAAGVRVCNGNGTMYFTVNPDGSATIDASGGGTCPVNIGGTLKIVTLTGTGSASSLGICSEELVARDVALDVAVSVYDPVFNTTTVEHYNWSAAVTTYPVAMPVIIDGEGRMGASLILSHIYLQCGQLDRQPTATFQWLQTT